MSLKDFRERIVDSLKAIAYEQAPRHIRRDVEREFLESLPSAPYEDVEPGVLLSDRVRHLATHFKLIEPFKAEKLKPAGYELSVGALYSMGGKTFRLTDTPGDNEISISPFEVVVIQTLERLNMPEFLIARWNVRTRWAYQGLLWVGAAQVDPGFKGYLACPLYNLSDSTVLLHYGEEIAVIDFVTTTSPLTQPEHEKYKPLTRTRLLFEDYAPDKLRSALATQAKDKIEGFEKEMKEFRGRLDLIVGVTFTAIGVLAAAAGIFATKTWPADINNFTPALLVASVAVTVALLSYVHSVYEHLVSTKRRTFSFLAVQLLILFMLALLLWQSFRIAPWHH